ncbi:putative Pyridoxal phosphate homeostasis protein [Blattamonas nauphoetae]|uniref:Pyridoxal phosphate homeostasis protein n=1 Tax=Blattamonas nauphoetae TaxID=2049346 RepID=A0ABQ9Y3B0_9EUKA|nr:putative Pyridoxal phosphate homeostasis protein [Blattamonas nauphoetae]
MTTSSVASNLQVVLKRIETLSSEAHRTNVPALIAVSKTKPSSLLMEAYIAGQRDFGENYVQELVDKVPEMPNDVKWHFIGHLQSNKVAQLIDGVPNLDTIQTVDSEKLATKLNNKLSTLGRTVNVMIEVRTSSEESKVGGVLPADVPAFVSFLLKECPSLNLTGLMTIEEPNNFSCFDTLVALRTALFESGPLKDTGRSLVLSMGMSGSFEEAIRRGSDVIRVGSSIFGARG